MEDNIFPELMAYGDPSSNTIDECLYEEGSDVSELLNITHYEPEELESTYTRKPQVKGWPRSIRGWFYYIMLLLGFDLNGQVGGDNEKGPNNPPPVYDVEAYKNFVGAFEIWEDVVATEKIHGSNARFLYDGKKLFAGSRKLWKSPKANCVWRRALNQLTWIELWCKSHTGYTLYGEVVPTQGGFNYGCAPGEIKFFVFDILGPDGKWLDYYNARYNVGGNLAWVPEVYTGMFEEEFVKKAAEGKSMVPGANHIREGVVVKPTIERENPVRRLGRLILKIVSNAYYERS